MSDPRVSTPVSAPSGERVDPSDLLRRIAVRPPYFALQDLRRSGTVLSATTVAEAPPFREHGPMTGAEMGRHAAIAGSCAIALEQRDDRQRFYLAREADCRFELNDAPYGAPVTLRAAVLEADRREATAAIDLEAGGAKMARFVVRYTILQQATFERLFQRHQLPSPNGQAEGLSPYGRLLSDEVERVASTASTDVAAVPAARCAGHFPDYPALPVAVLMGQLSHLAGVLAPAPYRVRRGLVRAQDLAWAGEPVRFQAARLADEAEGWRFVCHATADGRSVGGMDLWLGPADQHWTPTLGDDLS